MVRPASVAEGQVSVPEKEKRQVEAEHYLHVMCRNMYSDAFLLESLKKCNRCCI